MRIAIVNDVALAAEALKRFIINETTHEVAWIAVDGAQAVQKAGADTPDLILMDLVMPVMDGVQATRQIMSKSPTAILIVTASVDRLTSKVFEALGAGALDAVNTPVLGGPETGSDNALANKISTIARLVGHKSRLASPPPSFKDKTPIVAIGASSGGPAALASILTALPPQFPACLCIVQHIDSAFIRGLVDWLAGQTRLDIKMVLEGDCPRPGMVYVAGTDRHLVMKRSLCFGYDDHPLDSIHRPSIDVFFQSLAAEWSGRGAGVILTGMGSDGATGLVDLRKRGFFTIAQDKQTSSIYGMPKVAAERGGADKVLPLDQIPGALQSWVERRETARVARP